MTHYEPHPTVSYSNQQFVSYPIAYFMPQPIASNEYQLFGANPMPVECNAIQLPAAEDKKPDETELNSGL